MVTGLTVGRDGPRATTTPIGNGINIYTSEHGTITYPVPFPDNVTPSVVLSGFKNNASGGGHPSIIRIWTTRVTNSGFNFAVSDFNTSSNVEISWIASNPRAVD